MLPNTWRLPIKKLTRDISDISYKISVAETAQDRSPFCIFHIVNEIWQHPELIDTFLVENHWYNF